MALALCLQTRVDLAIYIVELQIHAQEPKAEHVRKLHAIMPWAITHPLKLLYRFMTCGRKLEPDSDAAFRREGTEQSDGGLRGRAVKGAVVGRWGTLDNRETCVHFLDWPRGQLTQFSRATFTFETLACINAVDQLIVLAILLHQMEE